MHALNIQIAVDRTPVLVVLSGSLTRTTVAEVHARLRPVFEKKRPLTFDLCGIEHIDSAGVALIGFALRRLGTGAKGCTISAMTELVADSLALGGWDYSGSTSLNADDAAPIAESVGGGFDEMRSSLLDFLLLLSETFYQAFVAPFRGSRLRPALIMEQMARIGAGSAPIVMLVSFLVGVTTALQAAIQLRQFGANIYIADMVGISMMRELGPLMAAILVAGRSGAAITAEIGTMQVNEEIDALRLIGINPIAYLAVPRFYAVTVTQVLLGMLAALVGIVGGFLIAFSYLDINATAYITETLSAVFLDDLIFNSYKSMAFGWIIVIVGVFFGFGVSGGAAGVGRATTNSVVVAIFSIIVADCVFSFI